MSNELKDYHEAPRIPSVFGNILQMRPNKDKPHLYMALHSFYRQRILQKVLETTVGTRAKCHHQPKSAQDRLQLQSSPYIEFLIAIFYNYWISDTVLIQSSISDLWEGPIYPRGSTVQSRVLMLTMHSCLLH